MHFKESLWGTGVVRYSLSVSAPGVDRHNVDTTSGGFWLKHLLGTHNAIGLMVQGVNGIAGRRLSPPSPPGGTRT
jgi:hypothetical protein